MLNNSEDIIPFDIAWQQLQPALDAEAKRREKRKRRFVFFWFIIATIGLGGGFVVWNSGEQMANEQRAKCKRQVEQMAKGKMQKANVERVNEQMAKMQRAKGKLENEQMANVQSAKGKMQNANVEMANEQMANDKMQKNQNVIVKNAMQIVKANKQIDITTRRSNITSKISLNNNLPTLRKPLHTLRLSDSRVANKEPNPSIGFSKADSKKIENVDNKPQIIAPQNQNNNVKTSIKKLENTIKKLPEDSIENKKTAAAISNQNIAINNQKPKTLASKTKNYHYGLQWNVPIGEGANYLDINAQQQPLAILIPTIWMSKNLGNKHSIELQFTPFAQYFLNNKTVVNNNDFNTIIQTGSQLNNAAIENRYTEKLTYNKLFTIEAGLFYNYKLSNKIKLGTGIGFNWLQSAILQSKVTKNGSIITQNSVFGIDKSDAQFANLHSSFLMGKLQAMYQFKKLHFGLSLSVPITNIFDATIQYNTNVNANILIKFSIK
jgi:hypothetical protein